MTEDSGIIILEGPDGYVVIVNPPDDSKVTVCISQEDASLQVLAPTGKSLRLSDLISIPKLSSAHVHVRQERRVPKWKPKLVVNNERE